MSAGSWLKEQVQDLGRSVMPTDAYSFFYEANINRAVVDLVLKSHSGNSCRDHLHRLERGTHEWIAIILDWRISTIEDSGVLDAAIVTLRETAEKLRQALQT
jgi:hypothetical protein